MPRCSSTILSHQEAHSHIPRGKRSAVSIRPPLFDMSSVGAPSPGASRPSLMSAIMRPSMGGTRASMGGMLRPSVALRDHSNVFADKKLQDTHAEVFSTDVLMEGELSKKGEGAFQSWKSRMFVLRGQELSYYGVENERCGALKGSMNVRGAHVERVDGSLTLSLTLENGNTRMLTAPNVQSLMDWLTALTLSSQAVVVEPTTDAALVVDHSRTTHILLVRHGHYASSQNPALDMEGPLTDLGIEQAKRTGAFLHDYLSARGVLKRFPVFPIYHSGVRRTEQTAHHMVAELFPKGSVQFIENKLFREAWPGNPLPSTNRKMLARENLDSMVSDCARLKLAYRTMFRHLLPSDLTTHEVPLSEQEKQHFADTITARTTQTRVNDRYRVVVCHANIIRWFVCKALGVDPDGTWGRMRYNHCGITALEVDSVGNVQLVNMNQTGHLHTTMLSENS